MREYLEYITGKIPNSDWILFEKIAIQVNKNKGSILLDYDEICKEIWFLRKGAVRKIENINGDIKTTHFYVAPFMFTVYKSLLRKEPSTMTLVCEAPCELDVIPYRKLNELYDKSHAVERVGRVMAEHQYIEEFELRKVLLSMDALQRYEHLEATQPEIFEHFQLKDIATFLGITPVSLSRLRKIRWRSK